MSGFSRKWFDDPRVLDALTRVLQHKRTAKPVDQAKAVLHELAEFGEPNSRYRALMDADKDRTAV